MTDSSIRTALGGEFEMVFAEPASSIAEQARGRGYTLLNDGLELGKPSPISGAAAEMRSTYGSLRPASDEEAATRDRWLAYVDADVAPMDVVNYRMYAALSEPCLTYPAYPLGLGYAAITQGGGRLEFRGPGRRQQGWYDKDDVSELRLSPAPRQLFEQRRRELLAAAAHIATAEGHLAFLASQHINGSSYLEDAPVLGNMEELEPYLAAVAGLRRVYLEGGLLNPARFPRSHRNLKFGSQREDNVRVMPGRVEYRGIHSYDGPDYDNGVRFLDGGLRYAEHTTDDERSRVFTVTMLQVTPLKGYTKEHDLHLRRVIETCAVPPWALPEGQQYVLDNVDDEHQDQVLSALTGRPFADGYYPEVNVLFTHALELGSDGTLQTSHELMARLLRICAYKPKIGFVDVPAINAKLRQFRVEPKTQIYHRVQGLDNKHALLGLRAATALPAVAPEDHAELLAAFRDK